MSAWGLGGVVALVLVFGAAVGSKIRSRESFLRFSTGLSQFGLRSERAMRMLAAGVVGTELLAVGTLVLPYEVNALVRFGPATALLVAFSVAVAVAAARNPRLTCHCFGSSAESRTGPHLAANAALIALGVAAMALPGDDHSLSDGARVLAVGLGIITGLLAVSISTIAEALVPQHNHPDSGLEEG